MRDYERIVNDEGETTGYRFFLDIPPGMPRDEVNLEVDWILDQIRRILPGEEFTAMERRGYTIKKDKLKAFSAEIIIRLD